MVLAQKNKIFSKKHKHTKKQQELFEATASHYATVTSCKILETYHTLNTT